MKQIVTLFLIFFAITTHAQTTPTFIPIVKQDHYSRSFMLDLGRLNKLQIETTSMQGLQHLPDINVLVKQFGMALTSLRDAVQPSVNARAFTYNANNIRAKIITIEEHKAKKTYYLEHDSLMDDLKMVQDTVYIYGISEVLKPARESYPYKFTFTLNDVNDLLTYTGSMLKDKILFLQAHVADDWIATSAANAHLATDTMITAPGPKGNIGGATGLGIHKSVNLQNYTKYLVPSFTLGLQINVHKDLILHQFALMEECHFLFADNAAGKTSTYINLYTTASYTRFTGPTTHAITPLYRHISLAYLIYRRSEYIDPRSFRFGITKIFFGNGMLRLEPVIYFHDFLKNISGGARLSFAI